MKVVLTDCSWNSYDVEIKHLPPGAEVVCARLSTEEGLIGACKDADAAMCEYAPFTRRVIEACPKLKIISVTAIGVDCVDTKAARELGIAVANVPNYCAYEVADHAMALMLAALRSVVHYERKVRQEIWDINDGPRLYRIHGMKLGLLGFGKIPQMVSRRAKGFGMEVIAYDPYLPPAVAKEYGVELVELDRILEECDVISCHLPLLPATAGSINLDLFRKMKKKPLFINTSRGKVVNEEDLCTALRQGLIRGAALDVIASEPADFCSEIFTFDNVIITPHAAFYSETALEEVRRRSAQNITGFFSNDLSGVSLIVKP